MRLNVKRQTADGRRETSKVKLGSEGVELPTGGAGVEHPRNQWFTHHSSRITYCLLLTAACILAFSGCEENFHPIQENNEDVPFSMYGYLDASADTQWLRVTPVREQIDQPPETPEMLVTVTNLESGHAEIMNDSLFVLEQGSRAVNVWTAMDIEPSQTYRVRAERPDGAASVVTVSTPPDFPTPLMLTAGFYETSGELFLNDVESVADVQVIWNIAGNLYMIPYRQKVRRYDHLGDYDYQVGLSGLTDVKLIFGDAPPPWPEDVVPRPDVVRQVFVASGGPEWTENIISVNDIYYTLPEEISNVENGLGYVVGIVSKTIPFHSCSEGPGEFVPCPVERPFFR